MNLKNIVNLLGLIMSKNIIKYTFKNTKTNFHF